MTETPPAPKDVADLLESLSDTTPEGASSAPGEDKPRRNAAAGEATHGTGITIFDGPEFGPDPHLGEIDLFKDVDAITVTAETRNTDASSVKVTLAEDRLFIGLGDHVRKEFRLPALVNEEAAVATFRNGVLDIVLPLRRAK